MNGPGTKMMSVTVAPGGMFGTATELFDAHTYAPPSRNGIDYDTARDGRFLMIKEPLPQGNANARTTLTVVTHWTDELRARVK